MVNNLVVYSLSCQPSSWIYQPCKASLSGLQLLLIRLARTRIRLAFQRISCISDWQWQLRCKVNAEASSLGLRWAAARSRRCIFIATAKVRKNAEARKFSAQKPPFLRGIFRPNFAINSKVKNPYYALYRISDGYFWNFIVFWIDFSGILSYFTI